jgi:hypothetical protein
MNRTMLGIISGVLMSALAIPVMAQGQPQPPPDQQQQQPPPPGRGGPMDGPGRGPGMGGPRGGGFGGGGGGFGGGGGRGMGFAQPANPGMTPEMQKFEMLRSYIDVVDRMTKMAQDPNSSGVAAVVAATDLLRQRGPDAAINYLSKILPDVKSVAVQRAIRIQLIDLYKQAGQSDKALEQLDVLIKGAQ